MVEGVDADVLVVGGGPAGASVAYHLASAGVDVAVLERATYPRDKICGDGLTPAAVRELALMGVDTRGWARNRGLIVHGGGHTLRLPWRESTTLPDYGMARQRRLLDRDLIRRAQAAGARLYTGATAAGAILDGSERVVGVRVRGRGGREVPARARIVVEAGGVAARLATSLGIEKRRDRPLGVAARTYFRSPLASSQWMVSLLELWSGEPGRSAQLPGYGWIFPLGDGTVNVGLGSVSSGAASQRIPYRDVFAQWIAHTPREWGFTRDTQLGPLRSGALPMGFNRKPHYTSGLVIVGDAGGMVSAFNGEGIGPALYSGRLAAQAIAQGLARPTRAGVDRALAAYPRALEQRYGGYYSLARVFVALIENPRIMHLCTTYGLPHPRLMKLVHKLLSDGYERSGGDFDDRLITAVAKAVPKV